MQSGPKKPSWRTPATGMPLSDLAAKLEEARRLHDQRLLTQAQTIYEEIVKALPRHFHALHALGIIAGQKNNPKKAVELLERAIESDPNNKAACVAHMNMGLAFMELGKLDAALASYDRAIAINSEFADAHHSRAMVLQAFRRTDAALAGYDRVIAINPSHADAYVNRGNLLRELQQFEAAIDNYDKAIALNRRIKFVHGIRHHTCMQICSWDGLETALAQLRESISSNQATSSPFFVLGFSDSAHLQRKAAEIRVHEKCPPNHELGQIKKRPKQHKMRIAYFSADFHNHVTMYVLAELFERHDRSKIDVTVLSFGPESDDAMRKRLRAACEDFVDVRTMSDADVAKLARKRKIDIAIDLKGFTQGNRAGIFALRAAPLQVNFLGYPSSMGASYIDYLIGDPTVIPEASQPFYSEKIAYLPNSYYPYDTTRKVSDRVFSREELGLPRSAFVFCCFNNSYKITPGVFDCWMRILRQVDASVLWLLEDNPKASSNLRQEAAKRGVNPERLVFAKRMALPEHLARHRSADLFIDTLPYNAHTTAIDALWAGLPVLTLPGEAFASRVAASLLKAIRLPELITATQEQYENTAVALAVDAQRLAGIKRRLADNRLTAPLFDAKLFTRHLEQAYQQMVERYQRDLPPEHIHIAVDNS
jgi:predicted O-linked N-acetylglucosamine transferase (SPINDLY family)